MGEFSKVGAVLEPVNIVEFLPLEECVKISISFIPAGLALGMMMLLLGLGISGILKIFKQV